MINCDFVLFPLVCMQHLVGENSPLQHCVRTLEPP